MVECQFEDHQKSTLTASFGYYGLSRVRYKKSEIGSIEKTFKGDRLLIGILMDIIQTVVMIEIHFDCRGRRKSLATFGNFGLRANQCR